MRSSLLVLGLLTSFAHAQPSPPVAPPHLTPIKCADGPDHSTLCIECTDDNLSCMRCVDSAPDKPCRADLTPAELEDLKGRGIVPTNPQTPGGGPTAPPPPPTDSTVQVSSTALPGGGTRLCRTTITNGVAGTPECKESGVPAAPTSPTAVATRTEEPYRHRRRGISFGIEVGHASPDDGQNIYGPGYGRGWVLGYWMFEARMEVYDLPDQTKTYDNVNYANGRFSIYSLAVRPTLLTVGPLEVNLLVGLAALSRPSLGTDPSDILSVTQLHDQYGLGLLAGAGIRIYDVFTVDVRGYLTSWMGMSGTRAEVGANDALTRTTLMDSPGGTPITLNIGAGWAF